MANKLKIDLLELNSTISNYKKGINDFEIMKKNLESAVDLLKNSGWNSAASNKYFESFDETWKKNMETHILILNYLKECLEEAQKEYDAVYNSIPNLGGVL